MANKESESKEKSEKENENKPKGGSTISFANTPQAKDDHYASSATGLTEDNSAIVYLNVMGNDLGGCSKTLWSLDNGVNNTGAMNGFIAGDLLAQDTARAESTSVDRSAHGAKIWITADGRVGYDATTLDASFKAQLQSLGAGQDGTDTFTYAIRLANGALSWATATVHFAGVNDGPVITSAAQTGAVSEGDDGASQTASGRVTFSDLDASDTHVLSVSVGPARGVASVGANGVWSYTVTDAGAVDALAVGEHLSDSFTVRVSDGHGGFATQVVTIDIVGTNDGPVITSVAQTGAVSEGDDGASQTASGRVTFSDADASDTHVLSVSVAAAYGVASVDQNGVWSYTVTDAGAADALAAGAHLADSFTVQVDDGHGGLATQVVAIDIAGTAEAVAEPRLAIVTGGYTETNRPAGSLGLTLQNSAGGFDALTFQSSGVPYYGYAERTQVVALGDVNGDGALDIVAGGISGNIDNTSAASIGVLLGDGAGGFAPSVALSNGNLSGFSESTGALVLGDLNGDGALDIIAGGFDYVGSGGVGVLPGHGDGTFATATSAHTGVIVEYPYYAIETTRALALADFNGDGALDVIAGGESVITGAGGVGVMLGNGDGSLQAGVAYHTGIVHNYLDETTVTIAVGDVNEDGFIDVLAGGTAVNFDLADSAYSLGLLLGNGDGTLEAATSISNGNMNRESLGDYEYTFDVKLADLNHDGHLDIIAASQTFSFYDNHVGSLFTRLGNGDGTFQAASVWSNGFNYFGSEVTDALAVADMNGDGNIDIVAGEGYGGVGLLYGNGDGTFQAALTLSAGAHSDYLQGNTIAVGLL